MRLNKTNLMLMIFLFILSAALFSQSRNVDATKPWSVRIADSFLERNPKVVMYDPTATQQRWNYEHGLMLHSLQQLFKHTGDKKYQEYIKQNLDALISADGKISGYEMDEFNIDQVTPGRAVLYLFQITGEQKYKIAADTLRKQLTYHPRTKSNGFWHKKIYPYQMWLDGLYMGQPFYAEYSKLFQRKKDFDDIAHQFELMYEKGKDSKTGLLFHAWDESKEQKWANKETGQSPHFWGRAMGWYMMALVDVLDFFPKNHPKRKMLIEQVKTLGEVLIKFRDPKSKVWYQILDLPDRAPNYLEASASCMYTYAFSKGVNKGYLNKKFLKWAQESWEGIKNTFLVIDDKGLINLEKTVSVAGLGGKPYRDGSFEYYMSEKVRTNDFKGYGPFLLAAIELEKAKVKM